MGIVTECVKLEKVELAIHEGSTDYKEQIFVDSSKRYQIIKVPQHNNLSELEIFFDYKKGYRIEKMVNDKECLVMKLDTSKEKPMDLVNGVKHVNNKFPTSSYTIVHESILTTGPVDLKSPIGKTAALFCGAGMKIQHAVSYVGEDLDGFATNLLRNYAEETITKRDLQVKMDLRCCSRGCITKESGRMKMVDVLNACNGNSAKLKAKCAIKNIPGGCTWRVVCPYRNGIWTCNASHKFHSLVCCDYICKK